jgi:hypothetical protein
MLSTLIEILYQNGLFEESNNVRNYRRWFIPISIVLECSVGTSEYYNLITNIFKIITRLLLGLLGSHIGNAVVRKNGKKNNKRQKK